MNSDNGSLLPLLISAFLLCCCCVVVLGAGGAAFFFWRRNRNKPAASAPAAPAPAPMPFAPPAPPPPAPPAPDATVFSRPPATAFTPPPPDLTSVTPLAGPASPIDADDIRAKLLELNGPDKPYAVQATGYKIAIAPSEVTGYLLEIAFDYSEKVARFVESNVAYAVPRLKQDARQVLEANGWSVRE